MNEKETVPCREIKSFVRREGRMTEAQKRALMALFPRWGIPRHQPISFHAIFQNDHPIVLEIGFGRGDALIQMARESPHLNFVGIEVHRPGIGSVLNQIQEQGLQNIRVMEGDAVEILEQQIPNESLSRVNLFFPDPWPKSRHHKRRIVQAKFLDLLAKKLVPGGMFHAASDWENYAEQMMEVISASPQFRNLFEGRRFSPDAMDRPETKFERRGIQLGHGVWDLVFLREKVITTTFSLDSRLEADSVFLFDLPLSQCRLMNAKEFPWLLLIPRHANLKDWIDLSFEDQIQLQREINHVAEKLKACFPCEKLNIASLGNKIPQLHIHVIARLSSDIAWPNPVWGVKTTRYSTSEGLEIILATNG